MYLEYFKFKEFPFSLVSDPRFLYLSEDHAKVKAYIEYAMKMQDSFLICTGEIGTGKTTLVNDALLREGQKSTIARIQVNHLSSEEFLQQLMLEFGFKPYDMQRIQILDKLKHYLHQQFRADKKVFLIVDEAHNVSADILEDIRYLADMESQGRKLIGIILVGQPELNTLLEKPEMEHIAQRIRLRCHIKPLKPSDIGAYLNHRLSVAGNKHTSLFSDDCMPVIHQFTGGRIRLINTLCDYALLHCYVEKISRVNSLIIQKSANELNWESYEKRYGESSDITRFQLPVYKTGSAKIIVKRNSHVIDEIILNKECLNIGRQSDNDIPIDDFKVSRYHAQILTQGSASYLHDLNSTNGTFINKRKVSVHKLTSGESFSIGTYEFIFMQSVVADFPEKVIEQAEERDITRQMTLDKRDKTRVQYKHPYINLVNHDNTSA